MSQESNNLVEENELKQAELAEIDQQREQRPGYSKPDLITGLAISGGGIRSGTFALGVLQALRELKLLRTIDYLSTVSGGGFIGSWLVANRYHGAEAEQKAEAELNKIEGEFKKSEIALNRAKNVLKFQAAHKAKAKVSAMAGLKPRNARRVQAAVKARASLKALALYKAKTKLYALSLHKAKTKLNTLVALKTQNARRVQAAVKTRASLKTQTEADAFLNDNSEHLRHLRRYSCYLTPRTSLVSADTWTAASIWMRNTSALQLLLGLFLMLLLLLPRLASYVFLFIAQCSHGWSNLFILSQIVGVILVGSLSYIRIRSFFKRSVEINSIWHKGLAIFIATLGVLFLAPVLWKLEAKSSEREWNAWIQIISWLTTVSVAWILSQFCFDFIFKKCIKIKSDWWYTGWAILIATLGARFLAPALWDLVVNSSELGLKTWFLISLGVAILAVVWLPSYRCIKSFFKHSAEIKSKYYESGVIVIAALGSGFLAPALWKLAAKSSAHSSELEWETWGQIGWLGAAVAIMLIILYLQCLIQTDDSLSWWQSQKQKASNLWTQLKSSTLAWRLAALFALSVAGACLVGKLTILAFEKVQDSTQLATALGTPMILFAYGTLIGFGISSSGATVPSRVLEWWSRIAAWLLIVSVFCCLLGLCSFEGPTLVRNLTDSEGNWLTWKSISAALAWLATTGAGLLAGKSDKTNGASQKNWIKETVAMVAPYVFVIGLLLLLSFAAEELVTLTAQWMEKQVNFAVAPSYAATTAQAEAVSNIFGLSVHAVLPALIHCAISPSILVFATVVLFIVVLVLLVILTLMLDINELSLNQFYRNRIMRCYLGGARIKDERTPDPFTGLDFDDDVAMKNLKVSEDCHFPGPFWIVNTAMNTTNKPDLDVAERQAESFVFTPLHCGFYREGFGVKVAGSNELDQGYRALSDFGFNAGSSQIHKDDGVTAAFAVSASGAAASPNWGYHTAPVTAFLMTIFNVRLGWWLPNPVIRSWKNRQPWAMSRYVLWELFGSASASDDCIYLSDGGHFDNMGLYELIRRQCKLIILSDGEQDEGYKFEGLGMAIRRCWVDFGAKIEIDVSDIKPKTDGGGCGSHCAIGKIYYNDFDGKKAADERTKPDAWLVYLKLSWTGDEDTDLQEYKAYNPTFPHDSTANQWFSESQFESYRKLGRHVAQTALAPTMKYLEKNQDMLISRLGEELNTYWTPPSASGASAFITNTEALMQIWKDVAKEENHLRFLDPLVLEWPDQALGQGQQNQNAKANIVKTITPPVLGSPEERAGRFLCQRLFQLMENVYVDQDLVEQYAHPDNSGWMALFRHWVQFKYFRDEWSYCRDTYGKRFQAFWDQTLAAEYH